MVTRRSKFYAKRVYTEAGVFASQKERRRWCQLQLMERAGKITDLERQIPFELRLPDGFLVEKYILDHRYFDPSACVWVHEDVKGVKTPDYRRKKKWMKHVYGIEIQEV